MKPLLLINNGDRSHASERLEQQLAELFDKRLEHWAIKRTHSLEECRSLVKGAEQGGFDTVLAGGGDGTLNVVLNASRGTQLALGVLPLGTVNCFVRSVGLSLDPFTACGQLIEGMTRPLSVGRLNEHWFICFASIGFDAAVVHGCNLKLKRWLKIGAFAIAGLQEFFALRGMRPFRISGVNGSDRAHSLMISKISYYGGIQIFPKARPDLSVAETFALKRRSRFDLLRMLLFSHSYSRDKRPLPPSIERFSFDNMLLEAEQPLFAQIDGELLSLTDPKRLEFEIIPEAIQFRLPN